MVDKLCMLRNAFVRKALEGNCSALEKTLAGVRRAVRSWGRDGVSGQQTPSLWGRGRP